MNEPANDNFPDWPRGLSRPLAAAYVGVSESTFDKMVRERLMPKPKLIFSRLVWDRVAVDQYFEALPGDTTAAQGDKAKGGWDQISA